jgi:predicted O-methyltransferase YrrM
VTFTAQLLNSGTYGIINHNEGKLLSMRSLKHWTAHYIVSRLAEKSYRLRHPDEPWLTPQAVRLLEGWLKPTDIILEFGSGRSTLWFARRVNRLVSVEHDPGWYDRVASTIQTQRLLNVTYLLKSIEGRPSEYASVTTQFEDNSLDVILVDGKLRDECANACLPKLKPGGLLVVDNADVYLPSQAMTPNAHHTGAASEGWQHFLDATINWRRCWTCNGVSATAFFFTPY